MTVQELHRKLLYCGYSELSAYITSNAVNQYIYQQLLKIRTKHRILTPALTLLNEVYYVCVKVQTDLKPGENTVERYVDDEKKWLGSPIEALVVLCFACGILKRKYRLSFNDKCFIDQVSSAINQVEFFDIAIKLVNFMESKDIYSPYEFPTMSCPVAQLPGSDTPEDIELWRSITDELSIPVIKSYLTLYPTRGEQEELLNCIVGAFTPEEKEHNADLIRQLRNAVSNGEFLSQNKLYSEGSSEEDYDFMFAANLQQTMEEAFNDRTEKYKQERDTYKARYEELKRKYDIEISQFQAKYQAVHAQLKDRKDSPAKEGISASYPEPAFTVKEIVAYVKENFSKPGADEICALLYRLAAEHHYLEGDVLNLIGGIVPAVLQRDMHYQYIELPNVQQFNNNPQRVVNQFGDDKNKK